MKARKMNSRQRALQIAMQLGVLSILTLITVAAFTHIATMLLFRRLVIGNRKPASASASSLESQEASSSDEFRVPVRAVLNSPASMDEDDASSMFQRVAQRLWALAEDLPNTLREGLLRDSGVTRDVYVKSFNHRGGSQVEDRQILLLCNPSGETIETLHEKAEALSKAIGFDTLTMFDYRPTGRSCKGLVAPDTTTMLEDAESVMQWLITVNGVKPENISVAGISLGGLQAMRLAIRHKEIPRLLLINTFSSFSCLLSSSLSLVPGALRIGGTSSFLPDITHNLSANLNTKMIAVVSVEEDERIPKRCTEEMLNAVGAGKNVLHLVMKGTHSKPQVDHNHLEMIREFLELREPVCEEIAGTASR